MTEEHRAVCYWPSERRPKEKLHGGKGDNKPDSDFDSKQLAIGIEHESEHTDDLNIAKEIAKDHLSEDPDYYKNLKEAKEPFKPGTPDRRGQVGLAPFEKPRRPKRYVAVRGHTVRHADFGDAKAAQDLVRAGYRVQVEGNMWRDYANELNEYNGPDSLETRIANARSKVRHSYTRDKTWTKAYDTHMGFKRSPAEWVSPSQRDASRAAVVQAATVVRRRTGRSSASIDAIEKKAGLTKPPAQESIWRDYANSINEDQLDEISWAGIKGAAKGTFDRLMGRKHGSGKAATAAPGYQAKLGHLYNLSNMTKEAGIRREVDRENADLPTIHKDGTVQMPPAWGPDRRKTPTPAFDKANDKRSASARHDRLGAMAHGFGLTSMDSLRSLGRGEDRPSDTAADTGGTVGRAAGQVAPPAAGSGQAKGLKDYGMSVSAIAKSGAVQKAKSIEAKKARVAGEKASVATWQAGRDADALAGASRTASYRQPYPKHESLWREYSFLDEVSDNRVLRMGYPNGYGFDVASDTGVYDKDNVKANRIAKRRGLVKRGAVTPKGAYKMRQHADRWVTWNRETPHGPSPAERGKLARGMAEDTMSGAICTTALGIGNSMNTTPATEDEQKKKRRKRRQTSTWLAGATAGVLA